MKNRTALTIVEMILVLALLAIFLVPTVLGITAYRQKQALNASADILSSILTRTHIYSREAKDQKIWGVRQKDAVSYEMVSRDARGTDVEAEFSLASPTRFGQPGFDVWFFVDTGEADAFEAIRLTAPRGNIVEVVVNKSGTVEIR